MLSPHQIIQTTISMRILRFIEITFPKYCKIDNSYVRYIYRNGNFNQAMNQESCYNLKPSTWSPLEAVCLTTWRSPTPHSPGPGDTAAAPSRDPSSAPGHLSLSGSTQTPASPHLASWPSGRRSMVCTY